MPLAARRMGRAGVICAQARGSDSCHRRYCRGGRMASTVARTAGEDRRDDRMNVVAEPVRRKALCRATNLRLSAAEPIFRSK